MQHQSGGGKGGGSGVEEMGNWNQPDTADENQDDAAPVVSAQKVETGKAAGSQSDNGEKHAGKACGIIRVGCPRRQQMFERGGNPKIHGRYAEIGLTEQMGNQRGGAACQCFDGGIDGRFGRIPQIVGKHAGPQPGKRHQQQQPRLFVGFGGRAGIGRSVGQHKREKKWTDCQV
ncbi:Uncharacterised protein [Neisseria meningitidis]|nr:Uncharacterised protein [Neisseria meningitidis]CWO85031.1 Uncharacterised protein [Neisseria meningitidis]CWO96907.1 Uncharacterised protein [Neisseria meningitidis]CWR81477.1 Uncharacterised protein [Neisseria meningitidis]CWS86353.1 Uncharacterised protein [Neisseria meningitidis]